MKILFRLAGVLLSVCLLPWGTVQARAVGTSAAAAVVICADTGDVLYESNADQRLSMASTTKIMTAWLLSEQPDLSKTLTVTKEMATVEGSSMGLLPGDTVSYRDLLYGMLLASGNDAANTTAIALAGSVPAFVKQMNERAAALGLQNTSFETPSGLDGAKHYTTARDLATIAAAALKNPQFKAACSSSSARLCYGNPPYNRTLTNHNRLLKSYDGLIGVKTGFTKKAGRCLVTAAERNGIRIVAVTLNDPNDWNDHAALLDYGFENACRVSFDQTGLPQTLPVVCADCDLVSLRAEETFFTVCEKNKNAITQTVLLPCFIYAPCVAGEVAGRVEYRLNGKLIGTKELLVAGDVHFYNPQVAFSVRFRKYLTFLLQCL